MEINQMSLSDLSDSTLQILKDKKIYFAHMSVGYEIMEGVEELAQEYPKMGLNIIELSDSVRLDTPAFAHSKIGKNRYPDSKIEGFCEMIDKGAASQADVALLKFCFVDVDRYTDINKLFDQYIEAVRQVQERNPDLKIIHLTVPLRVKPDDWKGKINQFLARDHNINRNKFNDKLRKHFSGEELFDLALYESTREDGSRVSYSVFGSIVYVLDPDITYDGGHLNEKGARYIGEKLLLKLIDVFQK